MNTNLWKMKRKKKGKNYLNWWSMQGLVKLRKMPGKIKLGTKDERKNCLVCEPN